MLVDKDLKLYWQHRGSLKRKRPWTHSHDNPSINFLLTVSSSWTFPYTRYLFPSHPLEAGLTANHLPGPSFCLRFQGQVSSSPNTGRDLHVISAKLFPIYNTSAFGMFPCIYKPRTRIWFWANAEEIVYDWLPKTTSAAPDMRLKLRKTTPCKGNCFGWDIWVTDWCGRNETQDHWPKPKIWGMERET